MKLYADSACRRRSQVLRDVAFLAWVVLWAWAGAAVHGTTSQLAEPGERTAGAATSLAGAMSAAGSSLDDVPLVGDGVAEPFEEPATASTALAAAGRGTAHAAERLALALGLSIALVPVLVVGSRYLPRRARFVRDATAAHRFVDGPGERELFALRAIAHQPLHLLGRVADDPVGAWRRGDRDTIRRLTDLELAAHGIVTGTETDR